MEKIIRNLNIKIDRFFSKKSSKIKIFEAFIIKDSDSIITSRRNPLVARLRFLSSREGRDKSNMLLLEGTHLLEEALKTAFVPSEIIATNSWLQKNLSTLQLIQKNISIIRVTELVLSAALTTKTPDGVASIFPLNGLPKRIEKPNFILALDRIQDPGNVGNLFRTALAADVEMVWLALGADPLSQKVLRASAGAVLHIPYLRSCSSEKDSVEELSGKLESASRQGFQVIATILPDSSQNDLPPNPYWTLDWSKPTVLVLGNEGTGIHPLIKSSCNSFVTLPHSKEVESLNVASVAVPMLLERQRAKMTTDIKI